jgi:hypothetical protein
MENPVYKILWTAFLGLLLAGLPPSTGAAKGSAEAVQWLKKALVSYDREDFGDAKISLQMALEKEPNFAEAYLLKGLLEYRDGALEKAETSWKRALDLNPRLPADMRKKLEGRAHAIEGKLTQQDFSHFRLQFNGAERREYAWEAVKVLDEAYNDLGSRFGTFPTKKFPVIIFTSGEFWEAWHAPMWLGGFFDNRDGRIRVRIDPPPGGAEEFRRRMRHEFTHAFINELYAKPMPTWFQEGAAQFYAYSEGGGLWKENRLEELKRTMKNAPWMDIGKIEEVIRKKNVSPGMIYLAYLQSEALILYIAHERGDSWIPSVIQRLQNGATFESAFKDVVGVNPAESLSKLQRHLS